MIGRPKGPRDPAKSLARQSGAKPPGSVDAMIGARLKAVRLLKDVTQAELAQGAGLTGQQVQKYEHGQSRLAVSTLLSFAKVLDVPPEALLPPTSHGDDPFNGLAQVLGERGVASLLKQVALIPEDRRAEVVRALQKIVG